MHAGGLACMIPGVMRFVVHGAMQKARSLEEKALAGATYACSRETEVGRTNLRAKGAVMLARRERLDLLGHAVRWLATSLGMLVGLLDSLGCVVLIGPGLVWARLELCWVDFVSQIGLNWTCKMGCEKPWAWAMSPTKIR